MIIRATDTELLLIAQGDHAALAGRLMAAWKADGFPTRPTRRVVLDATSLHDSGWEEEDAVPQRNPQTGQPYDFVSAPVAVRQRIWPRAVRRLAPRDRYIAALVAQHALTVYRRYAREPEWQGFFIELEGMRDDLFGTESATLSSFLQDYTIVGLGDLLSLVFCNGWPEPHLMESYHAILQGDLLTVAPDPFGGAKVPLEVRARRLPRRRYESDDALTEAWTRAPVMTLTGTAVGTSLPPFT